MVSARPAENFHSRGALGQEEGEQETLEQEMSELFLTQWIEEKKPGYAGMEESEPPE